MPRQQARRISMRISLTGVGLALLAALLGVGIAYAAASTNFSGYEIFPGYHGYNCPVATTCAATFTGWTDAASSWAPPRLSDGGSWSASINYQGTPGIGHSVSIGGGRWAWLQPDGTFRNGSIVSGQVMWPPVLTADIGCGAGVASIQAMLRTLSGVGGTLSGCLDDTHLAQVFPPRVWGTLSLG